MNDLSDLFDVVGTPPPPEPLDDFFTVIGMSPATRAAVSKNLEPADPDALAERIAIAGEGVTAAPTMEPVNATERALGDLAGSSVEGTDAASVLADLSTEPPDPLAWLDDEPIFTPTQLQDMHDTVQALENEFKESYIAYSAAEAKYKALLEDFNKANAELIETKKAEQKVAEGLEGRLKTAAEAYAMATKEHKFDEYVQCKRVADTITIADSAAAQTWAKDNYAAAINEVLNNDLMMGYLEGLHKNKQPLPAFAKLTVGKLRAEVSKKFVKTTVQENENDNS